LQQKRDAKTDDAAEVDNQRPATIRVQSHQEHQHEGRVPGYAVNRPNEYPTDAVVESSMARTGCRRWTTTGAATRPVTT
jgi:hypothetical protein